MWEGEYMKNTIYNLVNHNEVIPEIPNRDKYEVVIPVITDLHLLYKEPKNRTNFTLTSLSYLLNIKEFFEKNKVDYAIQTGDLHDRGEKETDTSTRNLVEKSLIDIRSSLKEFFIVMGNHEYTYINNNLFYNYTELMSESITGILKDRKVLYPTVNIFKALDKISFGDINIHFMHYDPKSRYTIDSEGFNICIFHDDMISFDSKQELYHHKLGKGISITDTDVMTNVDIAICGHIHTPLKPFRMNNKRGTLFIVPGSMCQRSVAETHDHVDIPSICINNKGVTIEYSRFNLGDIEDTVIKEVNEEQKKVRETTKAIKEFTKVYSNSQDLEDLLLQLPAEQANIIKNSINELVPESLVRYLGS